MKRDEWEFPYAANVLCDAAKAKVEHHQSRRDWWFSKKQETMTKIKSEGLEIDESLADAPMAMATNYGRRPNVSIRGDLQRDLMECAGKIKEHEAKAKSYEGWVDVLGSQGQTMLPLTHDDWLFFFSKR